MSKTKQQFLSRKQTDLIVYMVDHGLNQKDAAEKVNVNEATVWRWKQDDKFLNELEKATRNKFRALGAVAAGVLESLMELGKDENIKFKAAQLISERSLGKVANKIDANVSYSFEDILNAIHNNSGDSEDDAN